MWRVSPRQSKHVFRDEEYRDVDDNEDDDDDEDDEEEEDDGWWIQHHYILKLDIFFDIQRTLLSKE